jgi:hypothetical protein
MLWSRLTTLTKDVRRATRAHTQLAKRCFLARSPGLPRAEQLSLTRSRARPRWRHVRAHAADIGNGDGEARRHGRARTHGHAWRAHGATRDARPPAGGLTWCGSTHDRGRGAGHMPCPRHDRRAPRPTREHAAADRGARRRGRASWPACASFPGPGSCRPVAGARARTRASPPSTPLSGCAAPASAR